MASRKKTQAEIEAGIRARAAAAEARMEGRRASAEVAAAEQVANLPAAYAPASEGLRAVAPAALLWGALFAALPRGPRVQLRREKLMQAGELSLHYTGERLGQDDLDVFLVLLHLAHDAPLGAAVQLGGTELLGALGLTDSGDSRARLEERLHRLAAALIELRGERGDVLMGHLVASARRGRNGEAWRVTLARELLPAFGPGIAGVDLRVRVALHEKPLAQWLHAWISSHGGVPRPHGLMKLRELSGSTCRPGEFRRVLERALRALDAAHISVGMGRLLWEIRAGILHARRGVQDQRTEVAL